jgi:anti-anti-sigma regulatory factor
MVETVAPRVRMMQFEQPDLRKYLYDDADISESPLYREILDVVLSDLPADWTLIVNLKQLQPIGTAFYRCLLQLRRFLHSRPARLVLCNLSRQHREVFELFGGFQLFTVVHTESDAVQAAAEGKGVTISCRKAL